MARVRFVFAFLAVLVILLASSSLLYAQATRTWVSGVGDDANPCSRTAPCKTFAGAISKTAASGVISVLDPGGYGAVTITKSITIDATGSHGSILASGTNGVVINAAATDVVFLKGLQIHGSGTGLVGVKFLAGRALFVEDCMIYGFTDKGISFEPSVGVTKLFIKNTTIGNTVTIAGTGVVGINIMPTGDAKADAFIESTQVERNSNGLFSGSGSSTTITNSGISGNQNTGIYPKGTAVVNVSACAISSNANGIYVNAPDSTVRMNNTVVVGNNRGLVIGGLGGQIISLGNNMVTGNPNGDGVPSSTIAPQ